MPCPTGTATRSSPPAMTTSAISPSRTANQAAASSGRKFENPGATPSVSADGSKNAIVWAVATKTWNGSDNKPAVLYAFDAPRLSQPIYTSEQNSQRDRAAMATRFVIAVVVNGRVYFGARGEVEVYGLLK